MKKSYSVALNPFSSTSRLLAAAVALMAAPLSMAATIHVNTAGEIQNALKNASPGDEIVIAPGTYVGNTSTSGDTVAHFYINRSGTSSNKITLRSAQKSNKAVLAGANSNNAYAFYMENAKHWVIKDIKIRTAQKGLIMDGSSNNKIDNVQVYNTGAEAIHFRKDSSNNVLTNCHVFDTGNRAGKEGLGEGIYVGTHNGHESGINDNSNNNRIGGCHIGPNVRAEAFDIKSGTTGTIIEYNYINGKGIIGASGSPAADSYIDIKGDKVTIRNNKMEHKGDNNIYTAIMTYQEHKTSNIYDNEYDVPSGKSFLKLLDGRTHISNNTPLSSGINLVEKSHMNNGDEFDYNLDYSYIKNNLGPYPCFDELSSGCGSSSSSAPPSPNTSSSGGYTGEFDLPRKIEAERYNDANDTSNGNSGGSPGDCTYYGLDVDVQNSSDDSTCNIGWTASGETLDYNIDDAGGTYNITLRVSANSSGKRVQLLSNGSSLGTVTVNNSGWSGWHNKTLSGKSIPSNSKLTVKFLDGGVNLNYINIVASSTSTSTSSSTSGGGSNIVVANWNNNSAEEGQSTKHVGTSYSNGKVKLGLSTSNNDPYIRFSAPHNVSNYDKIKVRIRNGSSNGKTNFQIYFRKNGNEGGNGKGFTVSANDAWIEKTIDMSGKSNWSGDISHLRIDGPSYGGGNYRIDTVELIANDGSTSSTSSSSTSSSSGGSTSCLSYNSTGLKELSFSSGSGGCVNVSGGLDGMEVNIADSDANPGCDIRGSVTGSNGGSWTVDGNWESPTGLKGSKLTFNVTNNCRHFKLRVRP